MAQAGDPFSTPAPMDRMDYEEFADELLLITVTGVGECLTKFDKEKGEGTKSQYVTVDVAVLSGEKEGQILEAVRIFPRVLYARLAPRMGENPVLARLRVVKAKDDPELRGQYGKDAKIYRLDDDYNEADRARGLKFLEEQEAKKPDPFAKSDA